jgi:hypothetical protein
MPNNISKPLAFGEHAVCINNTSIHSFGELVDCLQLYLLPFSLTKLSLIIYIRKYLNGMPFWHSAKERQDNNNNNNSNKKNKLGKFDARAKKDDVFFLPKNCRHNRTHDT